MLKNRLYSVALKLAQKKFNAAKELELIRKNNLGSFYNFVDRKFYSKEFESVLRRADGTMTDVSGEKAQIFNDFLLVFSLLTIELSKRVDADICLTSITFTPTIVRRTIHKLKPTLSSGIDGVSNCFLRKCADSLCLVGGV